MPFIIDQNLCVACGSCFGNCPNRAIIRRGKECIVTEMCSDCGVCIQYCPMGSIGKGKTEAEFDNKKLDKALKDKLFLKRHITAMKFEDKAPQVHLPDNEMTDANRLQREDRRREDLRIGTPDKFHTAFEEK